MTIHDRSATLDPVRCSCGTGPGLPGVDVALARALALCAPVPGTEALAPAAAAGRVTSGPALGRRALPSFDNAAMDGFALRLADLAGPGPWTLPVALRIRAGDAAPPLPPGAAARILTGAPVPEGADAIVAQEDCDVAAGTIRLRAHPAPGQHLRRRSEDLAEGAQVVPAGCLIGPPQAGALAAAGLPTVEVRRRLRVGVLVTGAELLAPGAADGPALIGDANTPMLIAALTAPWIELLPPLRCGDDPEAIVAALGNLAGRVDLIVTTGGVSVGDEDHMRAAIRTAGGRIALSGVAMKPGKPLSFGRVGGAFWLGLPGNPVAVHVGWTVFGLPVAAALAGLAHPPLRKIAARLTAPVDHSPGRCEFRPATITGYGADGAMGVACLPDAGSHRIVHLAGAEALVLIPATEAGLPAGGLVEVLLP